jgi:hypothetical protein
MMNERQVSGPKFDLGTTVIGADIPRMAGRLWQLATTPGHLCRILK